MGIDGMLLWRALRNGPIAAIPREPKQQESLPNDHGCVLSCVFLGPASSSKGWTKGLLRAPGRRGRCTPLTYEGPKRPKSTITARLVPIRNHIRANSDKIIPLLPLPVHCQPRPPPGAALCGGRGKRPFRAFLRATTPRDKGTHQPARALGHFLLALHTEACLRSRGAPAGWRGLSRLCRDAPPTSSDGRGVAAARRRRPRARWILGLINAKKRILLGLWGRYWESGLRRGVPTPLRRSWQAGKQVDVPAVLALLAKLS